ncbi:MAG: hypothetical protein GXP25_05755 [Planctomycetes bacterium]|nr:hypothetical protein [Planctomycetota bacterium]
MKKIKWRFPLTRVHRGILQANGAFGAMIWGEKKLHITLNRADFWDRRGGMEWHEEMTFKNIRECLEQGDEDRLRKIFEGPPPPDGQPHRPSILPMGRLEIDFGKNARPVMGMLDVQTGEATVTVQRGRKTFDLGFVLSMERPLLYISLPKGLSVRQVRRVPSWEFVGDYLESISFKPPKRFNGKAMSGWVQMRPADPSMCLGYRKTSDGVIITSAYGKTGPKAQKNALALIDEAAEKGFKKVRKSNRSWWKAYWSDVPAIDVPSEDLAFIYYYGMYKFAGLTNPSGVPATLQGAWVEEHQMPPWQSDYHFNINVQECYWPTFMGNRLEHIRPLFDMILSWEPQLRHNAKTFLDIDDGLMLPHSVDDRCVCMGGFWTGTIDHGSTAWVAQLMWLYYRYSMDEAFLRDTAYPFMKGAMRVYEEMMEERDGKLVLPVTVSPEYGGSGMDAWGANASFQLACAHGLCDALIEASKVLGIEPEAKWLDISKRLPRYCTVGNQIALWEGQGLDHSHRHHSHLAGIYPFDTIDCDREPGKGAVARSIHTWTVKGMGEWSGWCVPWASIIHSRLRNGDMAELLLNIWRRVFTNENDGTLHDAHVKGFSVLQGRTHEKEIMQIEAGMAAITAVQEMLLQCVKGTIRIMPGVPERWRDVSYTNMRTEGAFLVSAQKRDGMLTKVKVISEAGGPLQIENSMAKKVIVEHGGKKQAISKPVIELSTRPGDVVTLKPKEASS